MDGQGSRAGVGQNLIGSTTPLEDIISALTAHGCPDLTCVIDSAACSNFPLAGGGFCDVYQGTTYGGTKVAVKSLRHYDRPGKDKDRKKILKRAARELYFWSKLKHPNVISLMGLAIFRGHLSMMSEWMENGNLMAYIRINPNANRIRLCMDVCAGLTHIHAKGMVHGDLKAANVMISRDHTAMIADFGNSQLKDLTLKFTNTTNASFSVRWAAPELFNEDNGTRVGKKADVYAYGMTVLETLTGKAPYDGLSEHCVIMKVAFNYEPPARPAAGLGDEVWEILQDCWIREQSRRPDIKHVKERLLALFSSLRRASRAKSNSNADPLEPAGKYELERLQGIKNLAWQCKNQGQLEQAELLYTQALASQRRSLGQHHPDTLQVMACLVATYTEQGRLEDAMQLHIEVLAARKRVLQQDHFDTLQVTADLAETYFKRGLLAESRTLAAELQAAQKRVLVPDHLESLQHTSQIVDLLNAQGRRHGRYYIPVSSQGSSTLVHPQPRS